VNLADALASARRRGERIAVAYLMVDRRRRSSLSATVRALRDGGARALELGFPFSDPIADGPVLEAAANVALRHGTSWSELLRWARTASPILPTAVMTYANPVLRRGLSTGLAELARAGVSGLIVPDLSYEESAPWRRAARRSRLSLVLLAAPGVSRSRIGRISRASRGFLYLVSRYGTTGAARDRGRVNLAPLVAEAHRAAPQLPVLIGFGVRDRTSATRALATGADGIVVGTALEERIARGTGPEALARWFASIARASPARRR
jgi:tryptophan synthase alpha chain